MRVFRRKLAILALALYWPTIFVLAHIPVPGIVLQVKVSDKVLHFLGYFVLVFLVWGVVKPDEKANWRKAAVWAILAGVTCYGMVDEWLQTFVAGRTADIKDWAADLTGAVASLLMLSLLSFWPATLLLAALTIMLLSNCTGVDITQVLPVTTLLFHFSSFALFTFLWVIYVCGLLQAAEGDDKIPLPHKMVSIYGVIFMLALPLALLCMVVLISLLLGRDFRSQDALFSVAGISIVILTAKLTHFCRSSMPQKP